MTLVCRAVLISVCCAVCLAACSLRRFDSSGGAPQVEAKVRELLRLGTVELRRGDADSLERAEAFYELALELRENDPRALDGLGSIAFRVGNLVRAEWFFEKACRADKRYDRAYEHLALIARSRGDERRARELLREAIRINPLNFRARNNLAVALSGLDAGDVSRLRARSEYFKADGIFRRQEQGVPADARRLRRNFQQFQEIEAELQGKREARSARE